MLKMDEIYFLLVVITDVMNMVNVRMVHVSVLLVGMDAIVPWRDVQIVVVVMVSVE